MPLPFTGMLNTLMFPMRQATETGCSPSTMIAAIPPWRYAGTMKIKTSISLSSDVLARVQNVTSKGTRSDFIEKALRYYLELLQRETRDKRDLDIINESASRLNSEANDILGFQA